MNYKQISILIGAAFALFVMVGAGLWQGIALRQDVVNMGKELVHQEEELHGIATTAERLAAREALTSILKDGTEDAPTVEVPKTEHDFGRIPKSGGTVETSFTVRNEGKGILSLGDITTSCACTSAEAAFSSILPGEETTIRVAFDPNVHAEPLERFSRNIYIPTNDPQRQEVVLTIYVDIIEEE